MTKFERSLYTANVDRRHLSHGDTLTNYAAMFSPINVQYKMKTFGLEKQEWYGAKWSQMAKRSVQYRCDFELKCKRFPTVREFVNSAHCKDEWRPISVLLPKSHPVHALKRKRDAQVHMEAYL